jgi:uncharacterized protein (DUF4415 family)
MPARGRVGRNWELSSGGPVVGPVTAVAGSRRAHRRERGRQGENAPARGCYDVVVSKRRVTLNLDEDVVAALEALPGRSLSAVANVALREAIEREAHRAAMLRWLDELDASHGAPTAQELSAADALLAAVERGDDPGTPGGAA